MGYSTEFTGRLTFTHDLTIKQLVALEALCGEDCREHPDWTDAHADDCSYIDLRVTADKEGLEWDESEKTYNLDRCVNVILREMRKNWPDFGLAGQLLAQGEEPTDRWLLTIGPDGWAYKERIALAAGSLVHCPYCERSFTLERPN